MASFADFEFALLCAAPNQNKLILNFVHNKQQSAIKLKSTRIDDIF